MNVAQAAARYLTDRRRIREFTHGTAAANRCTLTQLATAAGNPPIRKLGPHHIRRWLATQADLAPSTRRNRFSQIRTFCDYALEHGWIKKHPMTGMRSPKMPRYKPRGLTLDEASKVLLAATDERERVLILLGVQEGLRCCEMCNLELADVDLHDRLLRVVGKGGHERFVPLSVQTAQAILDYLHLYPATAGPLIRSYQTPTRALTPGRASDLLSQAFTRSGVKTGVRDGRSAHALRHTAANDVLTRSGGDVRLVQEFLGHQNLQTTSRYLNRQQAIGKLREAADGRVY